MEGNVFTGVYLSISGLMSFQGVSICSIRSPRGCVCPIGWVCPVGMLTPGGVDTCVEYQAGGMHPDGMLFLSLTNAIEGNLNPSDEAKSF